jgi:hypothetical protein
LIGNCATPLQLGKGLFVQKQTAQLSELLALLQNDSDDARILFLKVPCCVDRPAPALLCCALHITLHAAAAPADSTHECGCRCDARRHSASQRR